MDEKINWFLERIKSQKLAVWREINFQTWHTELETCAALLQDVWQKLGRNCQKVQGETSVFGQPSRPIEQGLRSLPVSRAAPIRTVVRNGGGEWPLLQSGSSLEIEMRGWSNQDRR